MRREPTSAGTWRPESAPNARGQPSTDSAAIAAVSCVERAIIAPARGYVLATVGFSARIVAEGSARAVRSALAALYDVRRKA